ncbi:hypothetical protein BGX31_005998 [Mortierella sp. GBA43]|nr:hypothetical protein BGX31_005998 [Mortierella sp. GBA43]
MTSTRFSPYQRYQPSSRQSQSQHGEHQYPQYPTRHQLQQNQAWQLQFHFQLEHQKKKLAARREQSQLHHLSPTVAATAMVNPTTRDGNMNTLLTGALRRGHGAGGGSTPLIGGMEGANKYDSGAGTSTELGTITATTMTATRDTIVGTGEIQNISEELEGESQDDYDDVFAEARSHDHHTQMTEQDQDQQGEEEPMVGRELEPEPDMSEQRPVDEDHVDTPSSSQAWMNDIESPQQHLQDTGAMTAATTTDTASTGRKGTVNPRSRFRSNMIKAAGTGPGREGKTRTNDSLETSVVVKDEEKNGGMDRHRREAGEGTGAGRSLRRSERQKGAHASSSSSSTGQKF